MTGEEYREKGLWAPDLNANLAVLFANPDPNISAFKKHVTGSKTEERVLR